MESPPSYPSNDPMTNDLVRHYDKKLQLLVLDTLDTCDRIDMPGPVRISVALGGLCHVMTMVAKAGSIDETVIHKTIATYFKIAAERRSCR